MSDGIGILHHRTNTAAILVLFILLVIISCTFCF
ncbi:YjcZ family sporulation protein [Paenibacillus eucommiae]|nr:YjcZ family sporulation protein [Paenibacillus eucommiae]